MNRISKAICLALLVVRCLAAADAPVLSWKPSDPPISPEDPRLARLGTAQFTLHTHVNLPEDATEITLIQRQTPDRKSGFRLFSKPSDGITTLSFEIAFDWKDPRNNRPLQLSVPLPRSTDRSHDLILRFTGPTLELLLDGVLVDEEWPVGAVAHAADQPLLLDAHDIEDCAFWDRSLTASEITAFNGGTTAVANREREIFGAERPLTQYWTPPGFNRWVGDCMPFFHEGRFHLFYLVDRHGHGSKWGLGAHQWAHVSTMDLVHWTSHPLAIPITDQAEGSICTGSAFANNGTIYGFYAVRTSDGSPARLTASRSADGIHFQKSDSSIALAPPYSGPPARDPMVFRDPATNLFHMLVTTELTDSIVARRNGCLAHLISTDLQHWEQQPPYIIPGFADQPECSDWFEWNGWYYLVFSNNGVARYRISRQPHGPWLKPKFDTFDGPQARVLKTAAFSGNRRLGAAFLTQASAGYAGHLVMREIIQRGDGTLGTAFPKEMQVPTGPQLNLAFQSLTGSIAGNPARLEVQSSDGLAIATAEGLPPNFRVTVQVHPHANTGAFGICVRGSGRYEKGHELRFEPARQKVVWRNCDADPITEFERSALYNVEGLERPFQLEIIVKNDILDASFAGHTLVTRAKPAFSGDRLFLFVQNGGADFENIQVQTLVK